MSSISLKLRFKVELAAKLIRSSDDLNSTKDSRNKSKTSLYKTSDKNSVRNSKIQANDFESIPGYEAIIAKLSPEDRDELHALMKTYNTSTLNSIFNIFQSKKLYSRLKSKQGLELLRTAYKDACKRFQDNQQYISDECELYLCLRDFIEMTELDCMDLFDLFKFNEFMAFTEQSFIILIYLLSSFECGYLTDFFNNFNDDLYNMIAGSETNINVSRLKEIGRLLGFNERMLAAHAKELNVEWVVDKNQFKEYYCTLLRTTDEKVQYNTLMSTKKNSMSQKGTCMSKACNIL
jgi:hypothetical protein